ncbi:RPL23A [Symbiodinium sp. CCMP2592]|nr:RPL23A [Symbiodinium sp. CCMP2592]
MPFCQFFKSLPGECEMVASQCSRDWRFLLAASARVTCCGAFPLASSIGASLTILRPPWDRLWGLGLSSCWLNAPFWISLPLTPMSASSVYEHQRLSLLTTARPAACFFPSLSGYQQRAWTLATVNDLSRLSVCSSGGPIGLTWWSPSAPFPATFVPNDCVITCLGQRSFRLCCTGVSLNCRWHPLVAGDTRPFACPTASVWRTAAVLLSSLQDTAYCDGGASWRLSPLAGVRIGEARVPGPAKQTCLRNWWQQEVPQTKGPSPNQRKGECVFAVINPTSILHKVPQCLQTNADVIFLSETAAVQQVQTSTGREFCKNGFKCHWGQPVPSHQHSEFSSPGLRGYAAGVAVVSRLPSRAARPSLPEVDRATCRLTEAFVRVGALEVRLVCVYGYPASRFDYRTANEDLLSRALDRVTQNGVPAIIAGDFNLPPSEVPSGQKLLDIGYREMFSLAKSARGVELPATCRGSTRHDSALLHPTLVPLWRDAWVLTDQHLFDTHAPLCFSLEACCQRPCRQIWNMPRSWSQLGLTKETFATAFAPRSQNLLRQAEACETVEDVDAVLRDFSIAAEHAASGALAELHRRDPVRHPQRSLPKAFRGRCQPLPVVKRELPCLARPARDGDYTPDVEATSVLARVRVRQVRRVQTLLRGLKKVVASRAHSFPSCLFLEWAAIVRAKGYTPSFKSWVLSVAHFTAFPLELPGIEWLEDLLQYLRFDCDALARREAKERKDKFRFRVALDQAEGGQKQGFSAVRRPENPPFTEVPCSVSVAVERHMPTVDATAWYQLARAVCLRVPGPALLSDCCCEVLEQAGRSVRLRGSDLPAVGQLRQQYIACTPQELHAAFRAFWEPLWQRDAGAACSSLEEWPAFVDCLQDCGEGLPPLKIRSYAPDLWELAIKRMGRHKATGACGWSPGDLKLLSGAAVQVLSMAFHQAVTIGLPEHLLRAKVGVLAKVPDPTSIQQSRPITVFATLYRIWSSVFTRQVLQQWSPNFPLAIAGSMPGRACRDLSYRQQHQIEQSLLSSVPRLGMSLDIVKAFNQLGWPPMFCMLRRAGVPEPELRFWFNCLKSLQRFPVLQGQMEQGIACHNGAPEGDPFSVAAMACLCFWAHRFCQSPRVDFDTYVDNWAWSSDSRSGLQTAIPRGLHFLSVLRLPVDWSKSYMWATKRSDRQWWRQQGLLLFPSECGIRLVSETKELGVSFKYDKQGHAASRNQRLVEGVQRLERLRGQPRSVCSKASLIQRGIWPACLYGSEGHCFSCSDLQKLRSLAARAMVGNYKVLSPFLALAALTDTVQDPQLYCLERQLQQLRRACRHDEETAASIVLLAATSGPLRAAHGPATALALSLQRIGLHIDLDGCIKGPDNDRLHLGTCTSRDVRMFLRSSWAYHVQLQVQHRNGLSCCAPPCAVVTGRLLLKLTAAEQLVIARHVTGAFGSEAAKAKWAEDADGSCPLCGAPQTKAHKFLSCPALSHVRKDWQQYVDCAVQSWPHWLHGPFATVPVDLEIPRLVFQTRKLEVPKLPEVVPSPWPRTIARFFTDGSCVHPTCPRAARAAYAVILDCSSSDIELPTLLRQFRVSGTLPAELLVADQGFVPGSQTINRAEFCAILQAIQLGVQLGVAQVEIWTDSQVAIDQWQHIAAGGLPAWPDLCEGLNFGAMPQVLLKKVASHQNLERLVGLPQWCAAGNTVADLAAKSALQREFSVVGDICQQAATSEAEQRDLLWLFWRYLLSLSREEARLLRTTVPEDPDTSPQVAPSTVREDGLQTGAEQWLQLSRPPFRSWLLPLPERAWLLACTWPPWLSAPLWHWARSLQWSEETYEGRAITGTAYIELLVNFVVVSRIVPTDTLAAACQLDGPQRSFPNPVTVRQLTHGMIEAVRQLERLSKCRLLPARRNKVFALRSLGYQDARIGVGIRPAFQNAESTVKILSQVLQQQSCLPLQHYVQTASVRLALTKDWKARRRFVLATAFVSIFHAIFLINSWVSRGKMSQALAIGISAPLLLNVPVSLHLTLQGQWWVQELSKAYPGWPEVFFSSNYALAWAGSMVTLVLSLYERKVCDLNQRALMTVFLGVICFTVIPLRAMLLVPQWFGDDWSWGKKALAKAAKAVKGTVSTKAKKIRTKVRFYRPKTLIKARDPKYPRRSVESRGDKLDKYRIIQCPVTTESAMKKIEEINTLVFLVDLKATKPKIKEAVKQLYDVKCAKVNTLIRPDGKKKAYVRLTQDYDALDVANRIGII